MVGVSSQQTSLPNVPNASPGDRRFFEQVKEILEIGEGVRGNVLDRKLTLRDLIDAGIAVFNQRGSKFNPSRDLAPSVQAPVLATPPEPEGFEATNGIGIVFLNWENAYESYANHSHTTIYRSTEDNFANATILAQSAGSSYVDDVPYELINEQTGELRGYYYWITFVSEAAVEGPPNDPAGTFARPVDDPAYILNRLQGLISESELAQGLLGRIALIDTPITGLVDRLVAEVQERAAQDETILVEVNRVEVTSKAADASFDALSQYIAERLLLLQQRIDNTDQGRSIEQIADRLNTLSVRTRARLADVEVDLSVSKQEVLTLQQKVDEIEGGVSISQLAQEVSVLEAEFNITRDDFTAHASGAIARLDTIETDLNAAEGAISVNATSITQVNARVDDTNAAVQQESSARVLAIDTLDGRVTVAEAKYTLKLNAGGAIAGFGIAVSSDEFDPGVHSEAIFAVDRFAIIDPDNNLLQFAVENGKVVMSGANIANTSIGTAQIGAAAITRAKIQDGEIVEAAIGSAAITSAKIAQHIQSDNWAAGLAGWAINKDGFAEFSNIYARGNVEATTIKADAANIISTLHLQGQSVTIPTAASATSAAGMSPPGFSPGAVNYYTALSHSHNSQGNPITLTSMVELYLAAEYAGGGETAEMRVDVVLQEDGAEILREQFARYVLVDSSGTSNEQIGKYRDSFNVYDQGFTVFTTQRQPPAGLHTYSIILEIRGGIGSGTTFSAQYKSRSITVLETKR